MKQRNHAFDLLCGLCIIRMVSLHIIGVCGKEEMNWWQTVMQWTYFFMSFFFFKAGYFNKSVAGSDLQYITDKAKRLLIPYVCCGLIGVIVYFSFYFPLVDRYQQFVEPLEWNHIWMTSSFYGNSPVWFLFSFFCTYIVVHYIEKVKQLHWIAITFPAISYWLHTVDNPLWLSLNNVFIGTYFFYLGHAWKWCMLHLNRKQILSLSCVLILLFCLLNYNFSGQYVMSKNLFTGNPLSAIVCATFILCGLAGLLLSIRTVRIPLLCFIGEHSMVYFISHYPILYYYKFMHLSFGRGIYGRTEDILILLPAVFIICSWLIPYIERIPWLSGRWQTKSSPSPQKTTD